MSHVRYFGRILVSRSFLVLFDSFYGSGWLRPRRKNRLRFPGLLRLAPAPAGSGSGWLRLRLAPAPVAPARAPTAPALARFAPAPGTGPRLAGPWLAGPGWPLAGPRPPALAPGPRHVRARRRLRRPRGPGPDSCPRIKDLAPGDADRRPVARPSGAWALFLSNNTMKI
jgi:hypothetical protein